MCVSYVCVVCVCTSVINLKVAKKNLVKKNLAIFKVEVIFMLYKAIIFLMSFFYNMHNTHIDISHIDISTPINKIDKTFITNYKKQFKKL